MDARWPRAAAAAPARAAFKVHPEDFRVAELSAEPAAGSGEHLYLLVEKTNYTTPEAARHLARAYHVPTRAVGYAGMKDKRAVCRQWFSVHTPVDGRRELVDQFEDRRLEVVDCTRSVRKLKPGMHAGNRFEVRLHGVAGGAWREGLERLAEEGAPNYFGRQRFGRDNLANATAWLESPRRKRLPRFRSGLYLSVVRAFLFNEVLAARVNDGSWARAVCGDVLEAGDPTGPLWGRGRSPSSGRAAELEAQALAPHEVLREGLEHAGLAQERRPLRLEARSFSWQEQGDTLTLAFELPPGAYATALLAELFELQEPEL